MLIRSFLGAGLAAVLAAGPASGPAVRLLTPETLRFGRVAEGQAVTGVIRFVNNGKAPVQIDRVHASCGCTATQSEKMRIDPGDSTAIRFSIRTQGFRGIIRKSITVYFASPDVGPLQTVVEGTVFTEIEVSPSFIDFQSTPLRPDTLYKELILIRNSSDRPLQIKSVRTTSKYLTVTPASAFVDPGRSLTLRVSLRPEKEITEDADLWIETDSAVKPKMSVPVFIHVSRNIRPVPPERKTGR
ncbi:DUF1573 domain-containing protein [bacterium]|nr:DUF1573 domain-containing protein [bacterium]